MPNEAITQYLALANAFEQEPNIEIVDAPSEIRVGHCLELLADVPSESVDCCVTSPPYWGLRNYGDPGRAWPEVSYRPLPGMPEVVVPASVAALGQEREPYHYVAHLVAVFREVRRVLKPAGTLWLNLGDTWISRGSSMGEDRRAGKGSQARARRYERPIGLKNKDLVGIPWVVALALQADGWYLRAENIWHKPNPLPAGAVQDRTTRAHEQVFHLSKSPRYLYDADAVREACTSRPQRRLNGGHKRRETGDQPAQTFSTCGPRDEPGHDAHPLGRNLRSVWTVPVARFPDAHFAVMPADLVRPCVLAGCPSGGLVLDPFAGAGTTGLVAVSEGRRFLGLEQSAEYATMARERIAVGEKPRRASSIATSSPRTSSSPVTPVREPASKPEQLTLSLAQMPLARIPFAG